MKHSSNTTFLSVVTIILLLMAYGIYKLAETDLFDASGDYVKELADDRDIAGFIDKAEAVSYYNLINGEVADYEETAIKYWGYITEKEVLNDKTARYSINIVMNKKDSTKMTDDYDRTSNGEALGPIIVHASKAYNTFAIGDYVWIYGTLEKYEKTDIHSKVPYLEAKKIVLDADIKY